MERKTCLEKKREDMAYLTEKGERRWIDTVPNVNDMWQEFLKKV